MAQSQSHSDDQLNPIIKPSNSGHAKDPAKRAPLSAKDSQFLGGEQTSDGAAAEANLENRRRDGNASEETPSTNNTTGANQSRSRKVRDGRELKH